MSVTGKQKTNEEVKSKSLLPSVFLCLFFNKSWRNCLVWVKVASCHWICVRRHDFLTLSCSWLTQAATQRLEHLRRSAYGKTKHFNIKNIFDIEQKHYLSKGMITFNKNDIYFEKTKQNSNFVQLLFFVSCAKVIGLSLAPSRLTFYTATAAEIPTKKWIKK